MDECFGDIFDLCYNKNMKLSEQIRNCRLCGELPKLVETSIQLGTTPFIIVGESPAKDGWIESKRAFYNTKGNLQASGRVLEKLLNNIGYSIGDIFFTECCKCIIENRKQLEKCSENCKPILLDQLKAIPCKIILTMGLHPTQALLNKKIKRYADYVGKEFDFVITDKKFILLPIYHPSPLNPKGYKANVPIFERLKFIVENMLA